MAGYEIVNEPQAESNEELASLYTKAVDSIRAVDPNHIIFLNDNHNPRYLDFSVFRDYEFPDNVVYVFHVYTKGVLARIPAYQAFGRERQVPIMCNEYGDLALIEFFETERIPHAPMHYKINRNNPNTPFYYLPSDNLYGRWITEIVSRSSNQRMIGQLIADLIERSELSRGLQDKLLEILQTKRILTEDDLKRWEETPTCKHAGSSPGSQTSKALAPWISLRRPFRRRPKHRGRN